MQLLVNACQPHQLARTSVRGRSESLLTTTRVESQNWSTRRGSNSHSPITVSRLGNVTVTGAYLQLRQTKNISSPSLFLRHTDLLPKHSGQMVDWGGFAPPSPRLRAGDSAVELPIETANRVRGTIWITGIFGGAGTAPQLLHVGVGGTVPYQGPLHTVTSPPHKLQIPTVRYGEYPLYIPAR